MHPEYALEGQVESGCLGAVAKATRRRGHSAHVAVTQVKKRDEIREQESIIRLPPQGSALLFNSNEVAARTADTTEGDYFAACYRERLAYRCGSGISSLEQISNVHPVRSTHSAFDGCRLSSSQTQECAS